MVRYLVIGPGAMAYFVFLGVCQKLKQQGRLDSLEEISGCSAGSVLGFMYCITKGDISQILDISLKIEIGKVMKPNIKSLLTHYGLVSHIRLRKLLVDVCTQVGVPEFTFKELFEFYPVKLHVSSYCLDSMKTVYFTVDSNPDMKVIDAICASISVPFLISSYKMNDFNYIDGGVAESTPGAPFLGKDDVLAIKCTNSRPIVITDVKSYTISVLYSCMSLRHVYEMPSIDLDISGEETYNFDATWDEKIKMFIKGNL